MHKPQAWPAAPHRVHPDHRWVWRNLNNCLPLWEKSAWFQDICAPDISWILTSNATHQVEVIGPVVRFPTDNGASIELANTTTGVPFDGAGPYTHAFLIRPNGGGTSQYFWRAGASSNQPAYLWMNGSKQLWVAHALSGGTTAEIASSSATALVEGQWNTVMVTWDSATVRLGVNSNMVGSVSAATIGTVAQRSIYRFGWGFATASDFVGDMGLALLVRRAWSPEEFARWSADPFGFLRPWSEVRAFSTPPPGDARPTPGPGATNVIVAM